MAWWNVDKLEYYTKLYQEAKKLNDQLSKENLGFTKKEILKFGKEKDKLERSRWDFRNEKTPDLTNIIDTNRVASGC